MTRLRCALLLSVVLLVAPSTPLAAAAAPEPALRVVDSAGGRALVDLPAMTAERLATVAVRTTGRYAAVVLQRQDGEVVLSALVAARSRFPAPLVLSSTAAPAGRYRTSVVGDGRTTVRLPVPGGRSARVVPVGRAAASLRLAEAPPLAPVVGAPASVLRVPLPAGEYRQYSLLHVNEGFPQALLVASLCVLPAEGTCATRPDSFTTASGPSVFGGTTRAETVLRRGRFVEGSVAQLETASAGAQTRDDLLALVISS